jgi:hypothetical protein
MPAHLIAAQDPREASIIKSSFDSFTAFAGVLGSV